SMRTIGAPANATVGATTPGGVHAVPRDEATNAAMISGDIGQLAPLMMTPEFLAASQNIFIPKPIPPFARAMHFVAGATHDVWEFRDESSQVVLSFLKRHPLQIKSMHTASGH